MNDIVYYFRGDIERWNAARRSYEWKPGYSESGSTGGTLYPWSTKAECRAEAKARGGRAVFVEQT